MPVGALTVAIHVLLVVVAAFLVGARIHRETHPASVDPSPEQQQLQRLTTTVSIGMFVLLIALVIGLDLGLLRVARIVG